MSKLYELANNYRNLMELIDNTEVPAEILNASLNVIEGDINTKVDSMCKMITSIQNDVTGLDSEVKRLSERKKSLENKISSIKDYMYNQLKSVDLKKVKTPLFNVGIQLNPASVNITDTDKVPMTYAVAQELKFDKKMILADLKEGKEVPGVEIKVTESLRIR